MVAPGGCVVARGACVVAPGGCAWLGGMCGCSWGVCMVALGGRAWDMMRYGYMVNDRAVRILLECILVLPKTIHEVRKPDSDREVLSPDTCT